MHDHHSPSRTQKLLLLAALLALCLLTACEYDRPIPERTAVQEKSDAQIPTTPNFLEHIHPQLLRNCLACHNHEFDEIFAFTGDPDKDHSMIKAEVDLQNPEDSNLLRMATDADSIHPGAQVISTNSDLYGDIVAWIEAGAKKDN